MDSEDFPKIVDPSSLTPKFSIVKDEKSRYCILNYAFLYS